MKPHLLFLFSFIVFTGVIKAQRVINLGKNINAPNLEELRPVVSTDGREIYFIRSLYRKSAGTEVQSLWYSALDEKGEWKTAQYLKAPFNIGTSHSSVEYISPDNNTILIKGYFKNGYRLPNRIGYSFLTRGPNGFEQARGINIIHFHNMSKGQFIGACLLPDGKGIITSFSETPDSPQSDLYFSKRVNDSTFSEPVFIQSLNKKGFTHFGAFVAADNKTLYFSSDRSGTLGNCDIWKTQRLDDTWLNWSEPENMGEPINTTGWDAYFYLDARGDYAYMIKDGEVVKIELVKKQQPDPVVLIKGKVMDKNTMKPVGAGIYYENLAKGNNEGIAISDSTTGNYQIALPYGKNYGFNALAHQYLPVSENLDLSTIAEYKEIERNLYLVPVVVGQTIRVNNIFFEFAKADLKRESDAELNRLYGYLNEKPALKIEISGHTDMVGDDASNQKLSEERAKAVQQYLINKGIDPGRIRYKGYGESKPLAANDTEEGRALNRRVEFTILEL